MTPLFNDDFKFQPGQILGGWGAFLQCALKLDNYTSNSVEVSECVCRGGGSWIWCKIISIIVQKPKPYHEELFISNYVYNASFMQ